MAVGCRCVSSADISDFSPPCPFAQDVPGALGGLRASVQPLPGRPSTRATGGLAAPAPDSSVPAVLGSLHLGGLRVYAGVALHSE